MFGELRELRVLNKATVKQVIAINTMNVIGYVEGIDYGENGSILVNWNDGHCGNYIKFSVDKEGDVKSCRY